MNNKKGFIPKDKLKEIIYQYIKSDLIKVELRDSYWSHNSYMNEFNFTIGSPREYDSRVIGCTLISSEELRWVIYVKDPHSMDGSIPIIIIFENKVEFIDDAKFTVFSREFMCGLYLKIKESVENVTDSDESNNEPVTSEYNVNEPKPIVEDKNPSVIGNNQITNSCNNDGNKRVYLLTIVGEKEHLYETTCVTRHAYLIKAIDEDEAFEIFWNRYKDFPEANIDKDCGSHMFDGYDYEECCRLHKELYTRTDKTHMIASEEADIIIDGVVNVDISDDIVYITEVGI